MSVQLEVSVRNAKLDAIETLIGTIPHLKLRTGAPPVDCAAADSGSVVVDITLPSDWMSAASAGVKAKLGTWQAAASGSGVIGHYRIYDSGAVARIQGTVTLTGSGGDLTVDNTNVASGQSVTITTYSWTEGNA